MKPIFDKEMEEAVLAALLNDKDAQVTFFNMVQTMQVFYDPEHLTIANVIRRLYDEKQSIDMLTVCEALKKDGHLKDVGGASHIAKIAGKVSYGAHIEIHSSVLLEKYLKRGVGQFASKLLMMSGSETSDAFEEIAEVQNGLESLLNQTLTERECGIDEVLEEESFRWQEHDETGMAGLSTGIQAIDALTGGMCDTDLVVIGARPGQGKTALVLSILRNMCLQNVPCGIFSLEMGRSQLVQRLLAQQSNVAAYKIKVNKLEQYDRIRLFEAKAVMRTWPIKINDEAGMTLRRLRTKATIWKKKHGIKFLVVDYLQLMGSDEKKINREAVISEISRGLKVLAKDLGIPIIALSQLSREVEKRPDKMPQLSDLRESGAIEQDADQIWFLMRPDYYKMDGTISVDGGNYDCADVCILDVAKFRAGETKQVPLKFHGMTMTFTDY